MRRRASLIVGADGSEWHETGISPDQLFGWLNAAAVGLYEQNEKIEVDLDKWASGAPLRVARARRRSFRPHSAPTRHRPLLRAIGATHAMRRRHRAPLQMTMARPSTRPTRTAASAPAATRPSCRRAAVTRRGRAASSQRTTSAWRACTTLGTCGSRRRSSSSSTGGRACRARTTPTSPTRSARCALPPELGGGSQAWRQSARRATAASGGRSTSAA